VCLYVGACVRLSGSICASVRGCTRASLSGFMCVQSHEAYLALADLVTVEEVNKVARSLLSYVSHFGKDLEAMEAFQTNPEQWLAWGPSRTTSMVACIPAFTAADGHSTGVLHTYVHTHVYVYTKPHMFFVSLSAIGMCVCYDLDSACFT
jgi:hypothetical protein